MAEWEAEIKIRRNGRLVRMERALGSTPETALYNVYNDMELWAQAQLHCDVCGSEKHDALGHQPNEPEPTTNHTNGSYSMIPDGAEGDS